MPSAHVEKFQGYIPQQILILSPLKAQRMSSNV